MNNRPTREEWRAMVKAVFDRLPQKVDEFAERRQEYSRFFRRDVPVIVFDAGELDSFVDDILNDIDEAMGDREDGL